MEYKVHIVQKLKKNWKIKTIPFCFHDNVIKQKKALLSNFEPTMQVIT